MSSPGLAEVADVTITGATLEDASDDRATIVERTEAEQDLLDESAANGSLYDASEVSSSVVDQTAIAWTDNVAVESVVVAERERGGSIGSDDLGIGVEATNTPDELDAAVATLGSGQITGFDGYSERSTGGVVHVTNGKYRISSGWERYRVKESKTDRDIYYYGHWITAYGEDVVGSWDHSPKVLDIRSRPKAGYKNTFLQLRNYWPKTTSPTCGPSGDLSISIYGFGASLPMQNCSNVSPDIDANDPQMRVMWNAGACNDGRVEGADLGMVVDVKPGKTAILSDYAYAQFSSAGKCDMYSPDNTRVIYTDPGW